MIERSGSPSYYWLLVLLYICFIINHTATFKIKWCTSLERLTSTTPGMNPILRFYWWQTVYYKIDDSDFLSDTREKRVHFVGIVEKLGYLMTFKVLPDDTHKIIYRSNTRSAEDPDTPNLRLDLFDGEEPLTKFIKSESDNNQDQTMMIMSPEDMIGRTFLGQLRDYGEIHRATIVKAISNHDKEL